MKDHSPSVLPASEAPKQSEKPELTEDKAEDGSSVSDASSVSSQGSNVHEVFVGGLDATVEEAEVRQAFAAVGEVLEVRLNRRKRTGECKGFGFVGYADHTTAEKACAEVKEVSGKPVGVHVSRGKHSVVEQLVVDELAETRADADSAAGISKLIKLLLSHNDRKAAVSAALKAVLMLPSRKVAPALGSGLPQEQPMHVMVGDISDIPDPDKYLDSYPRCKHLVETFRANPNTHNKTPLAILHEYATRLGLELLYTESAETSLGPFTVEAKLTSTGGAVLYATGSGKGRGKRDAKQVAAAAVLELLLTSVPESDFLMPGKAKQVKAPKPALSRPGMMPMIGRRPPGLQYTTSGNGRYMSSRAREDYPVGAPPGYIAGGYPMPAVNHAGGYNVRAVSRPMNGYRTMNRQLIQPPHALELGQLDALGYDYSTEQLLTAQQQSLGYITHPRMPQAMRTAHQQQLLSTAGLDAATYLSNQLFDSQEMAVTAAMQLQQTSKQMLLAQQQQQLGYLPQGLFAQQQAQAQQQQLVSAQSADGDYNSLYSKFDLVPSVEQPLSVSQQFGMQQSPLQLA
jgi:hypothetical protein